MTHKYFQNRPATFSLTGEHRFAFVDAPKEVNKQEIAETLKPQLDDITSKGLKKQADEIMKKGDAAGDEIALLFESFNKMYKDAQKDSPDKKPLDASLNDKRHLIDIAQRLGLVDQKDVEQFNALLQREAQGTPMRELLSKNKNMLVANARFTKSLNAFLDDPSSADALGTLYLAVKTQLDGVPKSDQSPMEWLVMLQAAGLLSDEAAATARVKLDQKTAADKQARDARVDPATIDRYDNGELIMGNNKTVSLESLVYQLQNADNTELMNGWSRLWMLAGERASLIKDMIGTKRRPRPTPKLVALRNELLDLLDKIQCLEPTLFRRHLTKERFQAVQYKDGLMRGDTCFGSLLSIETAARQYRVVAAGMPTGDKVQNYVTGEADQQIAQRDGFFEKSDDHRTAEQKAPESPFMRGPSAEDRQRWQEKDAAWAKATMTPGNFVNSPWYKSPTAASLTGDTLGVTENQRRANIQRIGSGLPLGEGAAAYKQEQENDIFAPSKRAWEKTMVPIMNEIDSLTTEEKNAIIPIKLGSIMGGTFLTMMEGYRERGNTSRAMPDVQIRNFEKFASQWTTLKQRAGIRGLKTRSPDVNRLRMPISRPAGLSDADWKKHNEVMREAEQAEKWLKSQNTKTKSVNQKDPAAKAPTAQPAESGADNDPARRAREQLASMETPERSKQFVQKIRAYLDEKEKASPLPKSEQVHDYLLKHPEQKVRLLQAVVDELPFFEQLKADFPKLQGQEFLMASDKFAAGTMSHTEWRDLWQKLINRKHALERIQKLATDK